MENNAQKLSVNFNAQIMGLRAKWYKQLDAWSTPLRDYVCLRITSHAVTQLMFLQPKYDREEFK